MEKLTLRIAGIVEESVVDGVGIRLTLFTQGCPHKCEGCHNAHTHDFNGGYEITVDEIAAKLKRNPLLDGITLSGGEPFAQAGVLALLSKWVHDNGMNVWCYSGYTFEELKERAEKDHSFKALFEEIDVLIDGRFEKEKLDLTLRFRGSSNQRLIDMKKTRQNGKVELWDED